ncbi:MAG: polymer-forming cytoskeletal protein, partial [Phycisphaerae bacterium]
TLRVPGGFEIMAELNGEFPTVIGPDARFKGELSFDKGVRVEGHFDGQIKSKGSFHVAEGAHVTANIEAANVRVEGECKGNLIVSEKLHLLATAKLEGDMRTNRLEIADGAIFAGNVVVGQVSAEQTARRSAPVPQQASPQPQGRPQLGPPAQGRQDPARPVQPPMPAGVPKPRQQDMRMPAGS